MGLASWHCPFGEYGAQLCVSILFVQYYEYFRTERLAPFWLVSFLAVCFLAVCFLAAYFLGCDRLAARLV